MRALQFITMMILSLPLASCAGAPSPRSGAILIEGAGETVFREACPHPLTNSQRIEAADEIEAAVGAGVKLQMTARNLNRLDGEAKACRMAKTKT